MRADKLVVVDELLGFYEVGDIATIIKATCIIPGASFLPGSPVDEKVLELLA